MDGMDWWLAGKDGRAAIANRRGGAPTKIVRTQSNLFRVAPSWKALFSSSSPCLDGRWVLLSPATCVRLQRLFLHGRMDGKQRRGTGRDGRGRGGGDEYGRPGLG